MFDVNFEWLRSAPGPFATNVTLVRAPRFPTLHSDGEACRALNDYRTGLLHSDDGSETAVEVELSWTQVLTDTELVLCPCVGDLPDDLHAYWLLAETYTDAVHRLAHLESLASPSSKDVVIGMLASASLHEAAAVTSADLAVFARRALPDATAVVDRARTLVQSFHRGRELALVVEQVVSSSLYELSELDSVAHAAASVITGHRALDRSLQPMLMTRLKEALDRGTLATLADVYVRAVTDTKDPQAGQRAVLDHPDADRLAGTREYRPGGDVLVAQYAASRAHVRRVVTAWDRGVRSGMAAAAYVNTSTVIVVHDWYRLVTMTAAPELLLELAGHYPALPVNKDLAVLVPKLELFALGDQDKSLDPTGNRWFTVFGPVPEGANWGAAIPVALHLWSQNGGTTKPQVRRSWEPEPPCLSYPSEALATGLGITTSP